MNVFARIANIGKTLKGILIVVVFAAVVVGGYFAYVQVMGFFGKVGEVAEDTGEFLAGRPTQHGAALGEACNVGADCRGFVSAFNEQGGVACCQNKCATTVKDWANIWWCPHECKSSIFAAAGTC
jgi:hypothetical protein